MPGIIVGSLAALGLVALMPYVFVQYLDPNEEYQVALAALGFGERVIGALCSLAGFGASSAALWLVRRKAAFWPASTLLATMVLPAVVIGPVMYKGDQLDIIELNVVLVMCFVALVWLTGFVESSTVRVVSSFSGRPSQASPAEAMDRTVPDRKIMDYALVLALIAGLVIVVLFVGLNVDLQRGLEDVYAARLYLRHVELGFVGYISNWVTVLAPSAIFGVLSGGPIQIAVATLMSLGLETVILVSTSARGGLWMAVLPLAYFFLRRFQFGNRLVLLLVGLFAFVVVLPLLGVWFEDPEGVLVSVPRRVFYVPGMLYGLAFETFTPFPPLEFIDLTSRVTGEVVQTRYTFILGALAGLGEEANANVSFLTDAYVNGRYWGMMIITVVVAATIGLVAGLAVLSRSTMGMLFLIALSQQYAETAFQQVYLTSGLVVVLGFLSIRIAVVGNDQSGRDAYASESERQAVA